MRCLDSPLVDEPERPLGAFNDQADSTFPGLASWWQRSASRCQSGQG